MKRISTRTAFSSSVPLVVVLSAVLCCCGAEKPAGEENQPGNQAVYSLDFAQDCIEAKDADLLYSVTQTNCYDPAGTSESTSKYANTKIIFKRYAGPLTGPFHASCPAGKIITQFDVLFLLRTEVEGTAHSFTIDAPAMEAGKVNYVEFYPSECTSQETVCVYNDDIGGVFTSTPWENIEPFLYVDWENSDFFHAGDGRIPKDSDPFRDVPEPGHRVVRDRAPERMDPLIRGEEDGSDAGLPGTAGVFSALPADTP